MQPSITSIKVPILYKILIHSSIGFLAKGTCTNSPTAHRIRADQVPFEVYDQDRNKYAFPVNLVTAPAPDVASAIIYKIPVEGPGGEIALKVYSPTTEAIKKGGLATADGRLPVVVDYHGGGFVIGGLASDEAWCRQICQQVGCVVVNVDYRLSPKYPHPVPAEDSWKAYCWVVANANKLGIDTKRIAVSGFSAGGCLAAVMSLLARDAPDIPDPVLQILIVPVLDARYMPLEGSCEQNVPYESYVTCEFAPMLPLARLVWFYNLWLGTGPDRKQRAEDFRASPMIAASHKNLPPASFHVAEIDPLSSEAKSYHEKLLAAGVESRLKVYKGCGHTFAHWDARLGAAKEFVSDTVHVLQEKFTV